MYIKKPFLFCIFLINISVVRLFGDHLSEEKSSNKQIAYFIELSQQIITHYPDIAKEITNDKVYIFDDRIYQAENGSYLLLNNEESVYVPILFEDSFGRYLSTSSEFIAKKLFKNICNNCKYEWEAGGIVIWCPKCRSTDIRSNVPNW